MKIPVVVCTKYQGVVFGETTDISADPITLENARMCLSWSQEVGGVFGLGEVGPSERCRISAPAPVVRLEGVTAIIGVTDAAAKAWKAAKVQGR